MNKKIILLPILAAVLFAAGCMTTYEDPRNEHIVEMTQPPTAALPTAVPIAKAETEYDGEGEFYCDAEGRWGKIYDGLVFGCSIDGADMQITIDGYQYPISDGDSYRNEVLLNDEHINKVNSEMKIELYSHGEKTKEYNFTNVLFYYSGQNSTTQINAKEYEKAEYFYFVSTGGQEEIDALSKMRQLRLLSINANLEYMKSGVYVETRAINLDALANLQQLRHLYIKDCVPVDISGIGCLQNLVSLRLDDECVSSIDGIEGLHNLEFLEMYSYTGTDSRPFEVLVSLRTLIVHTSLQLDSEFMSRVASLRYLQDLQLQDCDAVKSIPDMSRTSLKSLTIRGCDYIDSIDGAAKAKNLEELSLSYLDSLTNINCINDMENLRSIYLYNMKNLMDIDEFDVDNNIRACRIYDCGFETCAIVGSKNLEVLVADMYLLNGVEISQKLTSLFLDGMMEDQVELAGILPIESLESLSIYGGELLGLENIARCTNLKWLNISQGGGQIDLSPLAALTKLESFGMYYGNWDGLDAMAYTDDISFLSNLINLKHLDISVDGENDYSPLTKLVNLEELEIEAHGFYAPKGMGNLEKLETLLLDDCYTTKRDGFANFGELKNLKYFTKYEFNGPHSDEEVVVDISFIGEMTGLVSIYMDGSSPMYTPFPSLKKLTELKELYLYDITEGDYDFSGIWDAPNLEDVSLNCWDRLDVDGIGKLQSLRKLNLSSHEIANYEQIAELNNLETLRIPSYAPIDARIFYDIPGLEFIFD